MSTLHVAKTTDRVIENRDHLHNGMTFSKFRKGLIRAFAFDVIAISKYPKGYWLEQYKMYKAREAKARGPLCVRGIDPKTVDAFAWVHKTYSPTVKGE